MNILELIPRYTPQKSFGHKALVILEDDRKILMSYETTVAKIENGQLYIAHDAPQWDSATTIKHIREFNMQFSQDGQKLTKHEMETAPTWR